MIGLINFPHPPPPTPTTVQKGVQNICTHEQISTKNIYPVQDAPRKETQGNHPPHETTPRTQKYIHLLPPKLQAKTSRFPSPPTRTFEPRGAQGKTRKNQCQRGERASIIHKRY